MRDWYRSQLDEKACFLSKFVFFPTFSTQKKGQKNAKKQGPKK